MNSIMMKRLLWKECRQLLPACLGVLGIAVCLMLLLLIGLEQPSDKSMMLRAVSLFLPGVNLLAVFAVLMAGEREEGTDQLLCRLAIPQRQLLLLKCGMALLSSVAVFAILGLIVVLCVTLMRLPMSSIQHDDRHQLFSAIAWSVSFLSWGLFFSVICQKPVKMLILTAVASCLTPLSLDVLEMALVGNGWRLGNPQFDGLNEALRLVVIPGCLVLLSFYLAERWDERRWPRHIENLLSKWQGFSEWYEQSSAARSTPTRVRLKHWLSLRWGESLHPFGSYEFGRYLWLEWRGARRWAALWLVLGLASPGAMVFASNDSQMQFATTWSVLWTGVMCASMGASSFSGEQRDRQFRLLATHGTSPRLLLFTKQLVWCSVLFALVLIGHWAIAEGPGRRISLPYLELADQLSQFTAALCASLERFAGLQTWSRESPLLHLYRETPMAVARVTGVAFLATSFCFLIGQVCGLLITRGAIAMIVGVIGGLAALAWLHAMWFYDIPLLISVWPVLIGAEVLLLSRMSDWLDERARWSSRLKVAGIGIAFCGSSFFGTILYRAYEWSDAEQHVALRGVLNEHPSQAGSPDEIQLANEWSRLANQCGDTAQSDEWEVVDAMSDGIEVVGRPNREDAPLSESEQRRAALIKQATSLIARGSFSRLSGRSMYRTRGIQEVGYLLYSAAKRAVKNGELSLAKQHIHTLYELAVRLQNHGGSEEFDVAHSLKDRAYRAMQAWMLAPQQQASELRQVLFWNVEYSPHPLASLLMTEHADKKTFRRILAIDYRDATSAAYLEEFAPWRSQWWWETERARRVTAHRALDALKYIDAQDLNSFEVRQLGTAKTQRYETSRDHDWLLMARYAYSEILIRRAREDRLENDRRCLLIAMALRCHQLEHGAFPEQLEELVGPYLGELPVNRATGQPFEYRRQGFPLDVSFGAVLVPKETAVVWTAGRNKTPVAPKVFDGKAPDGTVIWEHFHSKPNGDETTEPERNRDDDSQLSVIPLKVR